MTGINEPFSSVFRLKNLASDTLSPASTKATANVISPSLLRTSFTISGRYSPRVAHSVATGINIMGCIISLISHVLLPLHHQFWHASSPNVRTLTFFQNIFCLCNGLCPRHRHAAPVRTEKNTTIHITHCFTYILVALVAIFLTIMAFIIIIIYNYNYNN